MKGTNPHLYHLFVRVQSQQLLGGPSRGGRFDMRSACPVCGTGAVRLDPLRLPAHDLPDSPVFLTVDFEMLIGAAVKRQLDNEGITCTRPVLDEVSGLPLEISELVPEATLPRFASSSSGYLRERPCPHCNRDGYFSTKRQPLFLKYSADVIQAYGSNDLLATYECFGNSVLRTNFSKSHFATPRYIANEHLTLVLSGYPGVEARQIELG
jgi:hypothetical protein